MRINRFIFLVLTLFFIVFTADIYLQPAFNSEFESVPAAGEGKLVWQKYNCQSCHQLYGLGGYLGPDLTNVISEPGKNEAYILGIIRSGNAQMPAFGLNEREEHDIIQFLKAADQSGSADPRGFRANVFGMIEPK
jgi:nitric oxide reductase subunit C